MKTSHFLTAALILVLQGNIYAQIENASASVIESETVETTIEKKGKKTEITEAQRINLAFEGIRSGDVAMFKKYWFPMMAYEFDKDGENMLTLAIKSGNAEMVSTVEEHSIINRKNADGETPLTLAIKSKNPAIIDIVVARAKAALRNDVGETPLFLALVHYDKIDFIQMLLSKGAAVNDRSNGITPLYKAVELNKVHLVALFIKNGADASIPNHDGHIPLALAVQENRENIVGILLHGSKDAQKDANWKNHLGEPLLVLAAANGQANAIRTLIKYGAHPNATDYMDNTALTMAARNGNPAIISYLVESGANLNHQNMLGITPIVVAAESGHFAAANYLASQGADVSTRSFAGIAASDFYSFTDYNINVDKP